jgi:hypothetical protein
MPDTFFRNEKIGHFHNILVNNVYIRIFPDGEVLYSIRYKHNDERKGRHFLTNAFEVFEDDQKRRHFLRKVTFFVTAEYLAQGVTTASICRVGGGGGCGVSANEYSFVHGAKINFGDLTPYLT